MKIENERYFLIKEMIKIYDDLENIISSGFSLPTSVWDLRNRVHKIVKPYIEGKD